MTIALATCSHESSRSARLADDTIASAWECDQCGHLRPFTSEDYAFCNARRWIPRAPEGISRLAWMFTSSEDKRTALGAR